MVNEVNKIVKNILICKGAVTLPTVGTLRLTRKCAQPMGKGLTPPEQTITFSSSEDAISIVDAIAEVANIAFADAEDIYLRWLDKTRSESRVVIGGVGVISDKSFKADDDILSQLNPFRGNVVIVSRRKSSKRWIAIAASITVILLVGGAAYLFMGSNATKDNTESVTKTPDNESNNIPTIVTTTPPTTTSTNIISNESEITDDVNISIANNEIDNGVVEETETETNTEIEQEVVEPIIVGPWHDNADIKHYVIVGSYKRRSNANGAIADIEAMTDVEIYCQSIKRGNMYSVAIFGSSDITSCEAFVSEHKELFPKAWIYSVE